MSIDYDALARSILEEEDDLVAGGEWLSAEERQQVAIVTDSAWEALCDDLASALEDAARDWLAAQQPWGES